MSLDVNKSVDIIEIMENYISKVRPRTEMRNQLDLNYEIQNQSIILNEIRPFWANSKKILTNGYAKATFIKSTNLWKLYWKRADNKWYSYNPVPTVSKLTDFLKLVDEDKFNCFKG